MKNIRLYLALVMTALALSSCEDAEEYGYAKMRTTINSDGSCSREISFNKEMNHNGIIIDSEWVGNPKNDQMTTVFYTRNYDNAAQMSEDIPLKLNGKRLQSKANVEKQFRWFYTEYTFTESFASIGDIFPLSPTLYADSEQLETWFVELRGITKVMNLSELINYFSDLGPKMDNWLSDNLINSGMDYIYAHYDSITNPPVNREKFMQLRDSLATFLRKQANGDFMTYDHQKGVQEFFNSNAYNIFFDDSPCAKGFAKHLTPLLSFSNLNMTYALTMPGEVTDSGNGFLSNGVITYILSGERLIPADFTITATSRQTNIWAYVVTAIVILLAIGSWVWKFFKKVH
ncbi:MAG: hypothetical protein II165_11015 [Bacteroidales bacterium]|nr:hypothetical protein [Bacteroidales bacterium]